jgi:superfamily II DNA or RNA helicase
VIDGDTIRAKVLGSKSEAHSTTIRFPPVGTKRPIECTCTCPTFTDGWEKICHHAVAMALTVHRQFHSGGELATTQNPWVRYLTDSANRTRRYVVEAKPNKWFVQVFETGSEVGAQRRGRDSLAPADRMAALYLDQEIDETDNGAHVLEDIALAGFLYYARHSNISLKGVGKLSFQQHPLRLRVRAETREKDNRVELHAFLEESVGDRSYDVKDGRVIVGSPTWFLLPTTGVIYPIHDTPPWVLESIAETSRILMDSRLTAEQMDSLSGHLQEVGVPRHDLFALASDSREIEKIVVSLEGDSERILVRLAARYGNVTLDISGSDPDSPRYSAQLGDEQIAFYRDLDGESEARKHLIEAKLHWDGEDSAFVASGDAAVDFMISGLAMLPESWERRIPKLPKVRSSTPSARVSVNSKGGSILDIDALVDVDGATDLISFRDLLRWLDEGRKWVTLADGSVVKLDPKALAPIAEAAGAINFDKQGKAEVSTYELGTLARLLTALPSADVAKEVRRLMESMTGERGTKAPKKAKALNAKLRDYQKSGFAWLWHLHETQMSGILADDMGLGKTVQAIALLTKAKEVDGDAPSLIVAPTSVVSVWKQELSKWAPSLTYVMWHGAERGENTRLLKKSDVVITSYAILRRDIDDLAKISFRYVLLDEAQYIKNWTTSTAKSAKQLKCEHRLALSGTPIENHLVDLWAIFDFLAPGFLGKISDFQKTYVKPIEDGDVQAVEALRARVRPFIMRRRKDDVASELPPKTTQTLFVQFGKSQLGLYNRILKAVKQEILGKVEESGIEKSQMTILAALTRLRQICTDPRLLQLPEGTALPGSAKLDAFKELISDCVGSGRKVLVFSQFVEMQKIICQALDELGIEHLWLHGGTKNREELVDKFQKKSGPPVFVISLKAGGSGLTLTEADTVIHYDPWWNPAVEDQATDRVHRIGQDKAVMVYRLVVENTVEQKMVELGESKREVAESALGRDTKVGKKLTLEDVERLLEAPSASWDNV